ncbi:hypothetical protein RDI58_022233 [Solanum bulbocastanum]|uniref:RNase H type-1 domain-containing protein n=1 Tax=Solanum bulbocastanum TaxID=147425 RepID=A0AAN8T5E5_SOLBU
MSWTLELGYRNIILEVDSQLLMDWITTKINPPCGISTQVLKLVSLSKQTHNFHCKHTFGEANFVADTLAKHSHTIPNPQIYFKWQQLPKQARAYYQLDMTEMPSFRRRKLKRINEPP